MNDIVLFTVGEKANYMIDRLLLERAGYQAVYYLNTGLDRNSGNVLWNTAAAAEPHDQDKWDEMPFMSEHLSFFKPKGICDKEKFGSILARSVTAVIYVTAESPLDEKIFHVIVESVKQADLLTIVLGETPPNVLSGQIGALSKEYADCTVCLGRAGLNLEAGEPGYGTDAAGDFPIAAGIKGMLGLLACRGLINLTFSDFRSVLQGKGYLFAAEQPGFKGSRELFATVTHFLENFVGKADKQVKIRILFAVVIDEAMDFEVIGQYWDDLTEVVGEPMIENIIYDIYRSEKTHEQQLAMAVVTWD